MSHSRTVVRALAPFLAIAGCAADENASAPRELNERMIVGDKQITSGPAVQNCTIERFKVHSDVMRRDIEVVIVLPPAYQVDPTARFPVLLAMHGRNAPYDTWASMVSLRQALEQQPMIVASFNADPSSWYLDSPLKADSQFTTFALKEFVPFLHRSYRIKPGRAHRGVAGFSMGGFGAMHFILTDPTAFSSVSGVSGAYEVTNAPRDGKTFGMELLLGDYESNKPAYDCLAIADRFRTAVAAKVALPRIQITCGTEDKLLGSSQRLETVLKELGLEPEYSTAPGGHDWKYWQANAPAVIDFHWRSFQQAEK